VLPALIRKFHEAKTDPASRPVVLWGDGSPLREFLYVEDLAEALLFLMEHCDQQDIGEFVNIGTGTDVSIRDLAELISGIVGYNGEIEWDTSKPNGTPRKLLDVRKMKTLGWEASTGLKEGIEKIYRWFVDNYTNIRA
jgi:GDP-L-fucose synthase